MPMHVKVFKSSPYTCTHKILYWKSWLTMQSFHSNREEGHDYSQYPLFPKNISITFIGPRRLLNCWCNMSRLLQVACHHERKATVHLFSSAFHMAWESPHKRSIIIKNIMISLMNLVVQWHGNTSASRCYTSLSLKLLCKMPSSTQKVIFSAALP